MQTPSSVPYSELDVKLPIVMLPVRIETRYFEIDAEQVELRIRIFPSQAHVTAARPGIDPAERDETIAYWRTRKTTGDTSAATEAAWQKLVQMFGDARAQYLRRILTPTVNASGGLVFPNVAINPLPDASTILAAEAIALPSRFFCAGHATGGGRMFQVAGNKVPQTVNVGPHGDPASTRWQSDFAAAEAIGLAMRVTILRSRLQHLSRIVVYGVREGADAATSQATLETLFDRHSRENGIALLAAGTPTNNTPAARVAVPAPAKGVTPSAGSDAGRLATALGMSASAFANASGAITATEPLVHAMHTALWPATLGYFLESLLWPAFTDEAAARGKTLFQKFVRPRGPYPTLAFGGHPYGVLPVSSLNWWRNSQGGTDRVANTINSMKSQWLVMSDYAPRLGKSADVGADLNTVLSQSPISTRWIGRTVHSGPTMMYTMFGPLSSIFPQIAQKYWDVLNGSATWRVSKEPALFWSQLRPAMDHFVFNDPGFKLDVNLVAAPSASRTARLTTNYIDAIATADIDPLKNHNLPGSSPRSMLYLLLRQATLLAMRRTASKFLATEPGDLLEGYYNDDPTKIVWNRLNTPIAALQNRSLAEVFKGPLPAHPNLTDFAQHRSALNTLAKLPVGELERLTSEALDACSYRLDAWATALASERLASMRAAKPAGSHVGAYGWVSAPPLPEVLAKDGAAPFIDADSEGYIHAPQMEHARTAAVLRAGFIARSQEGAQAPLAIDLSSDRVRDARGLIQAVRNGASMAALLGERIERWMVDAGLGTELSNVRQQFSLIDGSGRQRIDGLKAAQVWSSNPPPNLPVIASRLAGAMDALGDLLLAEAVHQQTTGNSTRAQAALAALETGASLPSEFHVTRTSADSTASTWRVVLPLAPAALNTWIAGIIGAPASLSATVTKSGQTPVSLTLTQIGVSATGLLEYVKSGAEASALSQLFAAKAGGGSVAYSPALQRALQAAYAISRLLRGSRTLQNSDLAPGRTALPSFQKSSARKEWLHDLARVRPSIEALDSLDFILRAAGKDLGLRFVAADKNLNIVSIGDLPAAPTGLLIDGWNETTPSTTATTGIAMHYDAPRSRAPQAILVVTPADPSAWSQEVVEASVMETADLTQCRVAQPSHVYGSFLPGLYFADNTAGDIVSSDLISLGTVAQVMNP